MEGWSTRWITWPALLRGCTGWLLTRRRMTKVSGGWKLQRLNMCKASYLRILLSIWTFENEIITSIIFQGIINTCHESYDRTDTKLGPEAFRSLHSIACIFVFVLSENDMPQTNKQKARQLGSISLNIWEFDMMTNYHWPNDHSCFFLIFSWYWICFHRFSESDEARTLHQNER